MASIQEIYEYPFIGGNHDGAPWDRNRPMQQWARPLEAGEDPNEVIQLYTYVPVTPAGVDVVRVGFFMTKGDAANYNIIAQDDPANIANSGPEAYWTQPPAPIPMRELAENESLKNTPFGLVLTVS